jgi:hypothetical protein
MVIGMLKKVWPYILPLPLNEQYNLLSSVFASKVSVEILQQVASTKRVYQRDLVKRLKQYSNKTVIGKLRKLVSSGVLKEGMEKTTVKGSKAGWLKWYEPTFIGRWIALLLLSPRKVPREETGKIIAELFNLYVKNVVKLCMRYHIDPGFLKNTFEEAFRSSEKGMA